MNYTLHLGNCLDTLLGMADNSVDSVVTDPPYGLSFMGKKWDYDVPSTEIWAECLRVLKPGGHLLAFAGTRTQHRMAARIEDAGFEIRDMIAWVYGSGFPKSMDVSKAIDKAAGADRPDSMVGGHRGIASDDVQTDRYKAVKDAIGHGVGCGTASRGTPITEAAQHWQGWGTALKPALEPITVARKPLIGTVAENVLEHGTGALNIDGCRVGTNDKLVAGGSLGVNSGDERTGKALGMFQNGTKNTFEQSALGRWPANLIHDGCDEVLAGFPANAGAAAPVHKRGSDKFRNSYGAFAGNVDEAGSTFHGDTGSAARFFYCAKASKKDRDEGLEAFEAKATAFGNQAQAELKRGNLDHDDGNSGMNKVKMRQNIHPTVKPTDLMRYLCRLVTPPGGVVLDPFMGSGSTGKAAMLEGFQFVGCELSPDYMEIARARIEAARTRADKTGGPKPVQKPKPRPVAQGQNDLFEAVA